MGAVHGTRCTLTDLDTVRIVVTLASEDREHLDQIVDQIREAAGSHPAVLSIEVEGEA